MVNDDKSTGTVTAPDSADRVLSTVFQSIHANTRYSGMTRDELADLLDIKEEENAALSKEVDRLSRLATLGELFRGVTHDVNNLLTGIRGYADLMRDSIPDNSPLVNYANTITQAASRGRDLFRSIMAFSRNEDVEYQNIGLDQIIQSTVDLFRPRGQGIIFHANVEEGTAPVYGDPVKLLQIVLNLCTNANEAVEDHGYIVVEAGNAAIDEEFVKQHNPKAVPGDYVFLKVRDNGSGMDTDTLRQVYDPMFTTKETGTGTGMSTVKRIMNEYSGIITIHSRVGEGTTITCYFPASKKKDIADQETAADALARGTESILVADDESTIRKITESALERCGYTVYMASSGAEAVELYSQHPDISLCVLDYRMPGMDGAKVFESISQRNPGMKFIFTSGFDMADEENQKGRVYLQKPYDTDVFLEKVRVLLDS